MLIRLITQGILIAGLCFGCASADDQGDAPNTGAEDETPEEPEAPEDPGICRGCVDDAGDCVLTRQDQACGTGGVACQACTGQETCSIESFVCEVPETPEEPETPSVLPTDGEWLLVVVDGVVSPINVGGTNWDGGTNKPDPYVQMLHIGRDQYFVTGKKDNTTEPTWNQPLVAEQPGNDTYFDATQIVGNLRIGLWDSDGNADDPFGTCDFQLTVDQVLTAGVVAFDCPRDVANNRAGFSLNIEIVSVPPL